MKNSSQMKIEELGANSTICVLLDATGRSLGTGSREVLEVLRSIAERSTNLDRLNGPLVITFRKEGASSI